jgi:hypothetical protein
MEQKKFEKILHTLYPDLKIVNYSLLERYDIGDDGEFNNKINPAIFVEVVGKSDSYGFSISEDIRRMTGIEVVIDKFD